MVLPIYCAPGIMHEILWVCTCKMGLHIRSNVHEAALIKSMPVYSVAVYGLPIPLESYGVGLC
jgi:hypothetical protein